MLDISTDASTRIQSSIRNIEHVGASPSLSFKLFDLVRNPETDIDEIARLIKRDPGICAQLLKLANSAYYACGSTIKTVSQAIVHLGLDTVKRLVMAIEMIGLFRNQEEFFCFDEQAFWKSSLAGAMVCRELAARLRLADTETPFICGLLRDFGVLVLRQYFPDVFKNIFQVCEEIKTSFPSACTFVCMFNQRFISYLLFLRWNLPAEILSAFTAPSHGDPTGILIPNMVMRTDYLLQANGYGQWDKYADHREVRSDLFDFDGESLEKQVQDIFTEVDSLVSTLVV